ncbi:MAG: CoA transferase [Dehalococcoidia bacterium]|nr:CoA transferase [Dehalococcoidia bacterium]
METVTRLQSSPGEDDESDEYAVSASSKGGRLSGPAGEDGITSHSEQYAGGWGTTVLPIERFRMLDLSRLFPGPMCSHILADMGMEVIKVEEPLPRYGIGRDMLTPADPTPEEEEHYAAYNSVARNKRSIALDLLDPKKRPRSQEVFFRLVKEADVVLNNYRPGTLEWMGIDYEKAREHNPRIIYCSITGFGQDGPYMGWPGHNSLFSAVAGTTAFEADGKPGRGSALGDLSGAMYGAVSILAALLHREETGQGQHIDVPMVATTMALDPLAFANYFRTRSAPPRAPSRRGGWSAVNYLQCEDGRWLIAQNYEQPFWEAFCRIIDRPQYIPLHLAQSSEVEDMAKDVRDIFLTRTRDEWLALLIEGGTCAAPVNSREEALGDPQLQHLGMIWKLRHPTEGEVAQTGFPVRFSQTPVSPRDFAPVLGQHTRDILRAAGYDDAAIAELERTSVVKSHPRQLAKE